MPVAIAGMHRSGTSMVTRLLNLCGLYLGREEDFLPSTEYNIEGYWENTKFLEMNDEILASFGGGWDLPPSLETGWEKSAHLAPLKDSSRQIIDGLSQQPVWGWKDPRNSLTLPFWKELVPNLLPFLVMSLSQAVYGGIMASLGLEALGIGKRSSPTMGMTLFYVQYYSAFLLGLWWWIIEPVIVIVLILTSLVMTSFGLDEIANPRSRSKA